MDDYIMIKRQFVLDAINIGLSGYITDDDKLTLEGMGIIASELPGIIKCEDCLWRVGRDCTRFTDLPVFMSDYCGRAKRR